ncbi:MarR family winged helix-turn-helix transcriptional regulator [Actinoplanes sp. NPDC051494]|uniref:MarR family winged helix-turn-helix transcriptional regulator n=1 Tax=Actinoplanes sp. NPDC051494 TaxID=3363907 RepID=UPI0037923A85
MSDLAEDLRSAVGDFVRGIRAHDTMPPGQAAALGHLSRAGDLSIADLARHEQVKHQSMTRTVGLLADQGLVTLGAAGHDRRRVVVSLTTTGTERLTAERHSRAERIEAALESLDPEERAIVARIPALLRKLVQDPRP